MSAAPKGKQPETGPSGTFDVETGEGRTDGWQAHLTGHLTRAADGRAYAVSLWITHEFWPHPETDETMVTRVLSGTLAPTDLDPELHAAAKPAEEGMPYELGRNRIRLVQNLAEAAAVTRDGKPNARREATYYGLADIDGAIERVAAWETAA